MTDCKHDWHFVQGQEVGLRCQRCGSTTTGNRPLTKEQMRGWIEETWQRCQDEAWSDGQAITIGNFTLSRYDEGSYWLAHKDGEGMQVRQERLQALVDELWKEF